MLWPHEVHRWRHPPLLNASPYVSHLHSLHYVSALLLLRATSPGFVMDMVVSTGIHRLFFFSLVPSLHFFLVWRFIVFPCDWLFLLASTGYASPPRETKARPHLDPNIWVHGSPRSYFYQPATQLFDHHFIPVLFWPS
jgi:hypothetical protein